MTENSMGNSRIVELMAKKMGKSASAAELEELEHLLGENPSYSFLAEILVSLKGSTEHFEKNIPGGELADTGWRHLAGLLNAGEEVVTEPAASGPGQPDDGEMTEQQGLWRRLTPLWRVVAAVIVLVAGSLVTWIYRREAGHRNPTYANKAIDVKYGRRSELILSDGTKVWLNAGSRLIYPDVFTGSSREVKLEGEAYFDVAQQANSIFLVHAGKITIKVLGTRFDVKAYREDAELSTTLISGKVQVILDDDPEKKIILSSREKLTVVNATASPATTIGRLSRNALDYQVQSLPAADHDSILETAWLENKLVVSNETFAAVARLLERKYDVRIDFDDEALKQEHLSGVFERETIRQVLDILRSTTRFTYKIEGKEIRLVSN